MRRGVPRRSKALAVAGITVAVLGVLTIATGVSARGLWWAPRKPVICQPWAPAWKDCVRTTKKAPAPPPPPQSSVPKPGPSNAPKASTTKPKSKPAPTKPPTTAAEATTTVAPSTTPPTTAAPSTTAAAKAAEEVPPAPAATEESLPVTGSGSGEIIGVGILLMGAGGALLLLRRNGI